MPLSRSPRMDRRRRAIREGIATSVDGNDEGRVSPTRTAKSAIEPGEFVKRERGAAYSHSVRRACQHRLVQFIPVRKLSLTGAILGSVLVPLTLCTLHYLVFVSGTLAWSNHPMSALLYSGHPRSLAAWLSSQLWLLCLAATVLTFRLRKHKLDDYDGEYRLWFWLVITCLIGSIDSTTNLTDLFGMALDRWSQVHVGWTGGAIVDATLATLIGLLGLRMCSELKSVPSSLVLWLVGLMCWAGSAALSQSLLKLEMSPAMREWLRTSLWLGGLTSIWLCGLVYLRSVFMEAQQRFLRRVSQAAQSMAWTDRVRSAMPQMPRFGWKKSAESADEESDDQKARRRKKPAASAETSERRATARTDQNDENSQGIAQPAKRRWGLGSLALRPPVSTAVKPRSSNADEESINERTSTPNASTPNASTAAAVPADPRSKAAQDAELEQEYGKRSGWFKRSQTAPAVAGNKQAKSNDSAADSSREPSQQKRTLRERLTWSRKKNDSDAQSQSEKPKKTKATSESGHEQDAPAKKRSWLRLPKPSLPKMSMPKVRMPKARIPKLKLPSFRLPPPNNTGPVEKSSTTANRTAENGSRPLPSTSGPIPFRPVDDDQDNARNLSKAERKKLKRMQRDDDQGERRAA